ncbi:MAG TPA: hypothetical protein VFW92_01790, partial [Candidatus Limnocylindrales bacterium]|nr:hypothetical protein [Candidatus Limnocylindrales bacterium]
MAVAQDPVRRSSMTDPGAWAIALAGWLVRGGLLVILLPLLSLPSPVGLSVLFGPDIVDANGLSARIRGLLTVAALVALVLLILALLASAWLERAAAERAAAAGLAAGPSAPQREAAARPALAGLMAIGFVSLAPLAAALAAVTGQIVSATTAELIFPSRVDVPLAVRVVQGAWSGVALLAVAIVVADLFHAVAVR